MTDTSSAYDRPLPVPVHEDLSKPFWEATKRHELIMPKCNSCSSIFFYPREACPECTSMDLDWTEVSGQGRVYSYTHVRQAVHPYFQSENGHIYAIIELLEGPKVPSNILECEPEDIFVDMNVVATFEDVNDDFTLLKFKPGP